MTATATDPETVRDLPWKKCPGCGRERRISKATGLMKYHRRWVTRAEVIASNESYPALSAFRLIPPEYGYMVVCAGINRLPAE